MVEKKIIFYSKENQKSIKKIEKATKELINVLGGNVIERNYYHLTFGKRS